MKLWINISFFKWTKLILPAHSPHCFLCHVLILDTLWSYLSFIHVIGVSVWLHEIQFITICMQSSLIQAVIMKIHGGLIILLVPWCHPIKEKEYLPIKVQNIFANVVDQCNWNEWLKINDQNIIFHAAILKNTPTWQSLKPNMSHRSAWLFRRFRPNFLSLPFWVGCPLWPAAWPLWGISCPIWLLYVSSSRNGWLDCQSGTADLPFLWGKMALANPYIQSAFIIKTQLSTKKPI